MEDLHRVIADREQSDVLRLEGGPHCLQLDQLRAAERSPVGASMENDERFALPTGGMEIDRGSALVGQADVGKPLPLLRPDLREVSSG